MCQIAQVKEQYFIDDQRAIVKRLNTAIKYTNDHPAHMTYPKLDIATLRIVEYTDAAFANYPDLTFQ